jgi:2-polyprenyl-3-methyl-5-hydroxy-6-metoxy-1,4-benzoquinol methylase
MNSHDKTPADDCEAGSAAPGRNPESLDLDAAAALKGMTLRGLKGLVIGAQGGEQAAALAGLGMRVTATDSGAALLNHARQFAFRAGRAVNFVQDNILDSSLQGPYDIVFDRSVFCALTPEQHDIYAATVCRIMSDGALLMVKTPWARNAQPGQAGFRPQDFVDVFGRLFVIDYIKRSVYKEISSQAPGMLFCAMRKH